MNDPRYPGAEADNGVTKAVWQLLLAALFKLFITVFTFGIKVGSRLAIQCNTFNSISQFQFALCQAVFIPEKKSKSTLTYGISLGW